MQKKRHDVNNICSVWKRVWGSGTKRSWHDNVDADELIRMLFDTSIQNSYLVFRCVKCHSKQPHDDRNVSPKDISEEGSRLKPISIE